MSVSARFRIASLFAASIVSVVSPVGRSIANPPDSTVAQPTTPEVAQISYDDADLSPAFRYNDDQITQALRDGKALYDDSKGGDEALDRWTSKVKVARFKTEDTVGRVLCLSIRGGDFALEGYEAAHMSETPAIPDAVRSQGFHTMAEFAIRLTFDGINGRRPLWKNLAVKTPHADQTVGDGPSKDAIGDTMPDDIHVLKMIVVDDSGTVTRCRSRWRIPQRRIIRGSVRATAVLSSLVRKQRQKR